MLNLRLSTTVRLALVALMAMLFSSGVLAQVPELPDLTIGDADTSGDPLEVFINVVRVVVAAVLWGGVLFLGVKTIMESIKDIQAAKDGDTKWVSAGKSMAGGIFFFVMALAIAIWIQTAFL